MSIARDLRTLFVHANFRKLFAVRLVSQCGDGMLQAGLATLFFFSPTKMTTAGGVAAAFAVMLLPFTIVGPFAGPLLDRWSRRQVLLVGNVARVVIALLIAGLLLSGGSLPAVYLLALVALGVNRFLLAALSAALPRVVPDDQLLIANTVTPSLGAVSAVTGAGVGFLISQLTPITAVRNAGALIAAAIAFFLASLLSLRMSRMLLGPAQRSANILADLGAVLGDLAQGARYVIARGTPGVALTVMAIHRFLYGINFIALILISRNLLATQSDQGLAIFATLSGISFAGNGLGIVATPFANTRMLPASWIGCCLLVGAISQWLLLVKPTMVTAALGALLLGFSVQGAKIAVDTIVQHDTADAYRGRTFALYDMAYNAAFASAAALAAVIFPDTGWSGPVFAILGCVYLAVALSYRLAVVHLQGAPRQVT